MKIDVINTSEAMRILNCSRSTVCRLIETRVITTAFTGFAEGFVGRPGWRMYRDEIEELAKSGVKRINDKPSVETKKKNKSEVETNNRENIRKVLGELQVCLALLSETIGKLKEEL